MTVFVLLATTMVGSAVLWLLRPAALAAGRQAPRVRGSGVSLARATAVFLVLAIPAAAALIYAQTGTIEAIAPPLDPERVKIDERVGRLAARLARQPDDVPGWRSLARSYEVLGRPAEAARAYRRIVEFQPGDADALADLADALSMAQGGRFAGEPIALARDALRLDPAQAKALAIAANEASERNDRAAAVAFWERLKSLVPAGSDVARSIDANIAEAREGSGRARGP